MTSPATRTFRRSRLLAAAVAERSWRGEQLYPGLPWSQCDLVPAAVDELERGGDALVPPVPGDQAAVPEHPHPPLAGDHVVRGGVAEDVAQAQEPGLDPHHDDVGREDAV